MDYKKVYDDICHRGQNRKLDGYKEKHHIIPKCMGGLDDSSNITSLTSREHFLCHWLLSRMYPSNRKIQFAFWSMANQNNPNQSRTKVSSRGYAEAREAHAKSLSLRNRERGIRPYKPEGFRLSEESIAKMKATKKRNPQEFSEETRAKLRLASSRRSKEKCLYCNKEYLKCHARLHGKNKCNAK